MSWELKHWDYRIIGECEHDGREWINDFQLHNGSFDSRYSDTETRLPSVICNGIGEYNVAEVIIAAIATDFLLTVS